jgi:hypothetical protein
MRGVEPLFFTLFIVLFCMALIWFGLITSFFKRLETKHPEQYESLGRPSVFARNNISNSSAALKFLLLRRYRALNDPELTSFANGMVVYFAVYAALFVLLASQFFLPTHAP